MMIQICLLNQGIKIKFKNCFNMILGLGFLNYFCTVYALGKHGICNSEDKSFIQKRYERKYRNYIKVF